MLSGRHASSRSRTPTRRWVRLVFSYVGWATAWLVFGTLVGEYLGIKFVAPDIDHVSWLSFGRLRPVHTNTVFWGWSSLAMIGMSLYVVPKTSRCKLFSFPLAYLSLTLINASVAHRQRAADERHQQRRTGVPRVHLAGAGGLRDRRDPHRLQPHTHDRHTRPRRDLHLELVHHGRLSVDHRVARHRVSAVVPAERHQRDGDPGFLHAHGRGHVVHASRPRAHLLHAAATPQQADLLVLSRRPGVLDADGLLLDDRRASLHLRAHPLVVADASPSSSASAWS